MGTHRERGTKRPGNLIPGRLFRYLLDFELAKATRLGYSVSLICLTPDLRPPATHAVPARQIARAALGRLRQTDVGTTVSRTVVGLLLVDANTQTLPRIFNRVANAVEQGRRGFALGDDWVSVSAGAACFPETATNAQKLMRQATDLMTRAQREGGDWLYVASTTS